MIVLRAATEQEMVAAFLRAEIASPRWRDAVLASLHRHGLERSVVDAPDLEDAEGNAARARVLGEYRGYGFGRDLFEQYRPPGSATWERVALDADDLARVRYVDYSYWNELSGGTRRAAVAAGNVRRGVTACGVPNDGFWSAAAVLEGGGRFPELILVRPGEAAAPVVLEGHLRLTAYFLAPPGARPAELAALLGTAPAFASW